MWDDKPPQDHRAKEECLMVDIITARREAGKFFYEYGFGALLSSVAQNRLGEIIFSLAMKGNQSKTTDFAELNQGFIAVLKITDKFPIKFFFVSTPFGGGNKKPLRYIPEVLPWDEP